MFHNKTKSKTNQNEISLQISTKWNEPIRNSNRFKIITKIKFHIKNIIKYKIRIAEQLIEITVL